MRDGVISILFLVFSYSNINGQNLSISASFGFATKQTEIPPLQADYLFSRKIQFLNSNLLDVGMDISKSVNAGISFSYSIANTGQYFAVGSGKQPVTRLPYYGVGLYGKYSFLKSFKFQPYVYGGAGALFNYPKKMDGYSAETGVAVFTDARGGLQYKGKKWITYFAEAGFAYRRGIGRLGVVYRPFGNN